MMPLELSMRGPFPMKRWTWNPGVALLLSAAVSPPAAAKSARHADPISYEQHGSIAVSAARRQSARAKQAPLATVHRRPPLAPQASDPMRDLMSLTAELDRQRDAPTTPESDPKGLVMPDLQIAWNGKSRAYMQHYTTTGIGRKRMAEWLERLTRYGPSLQRILSGHGVPRDLIYVAMVESGIHAGRRSRVGASGIWQFMPATGESYGLHQSSWVDDRNHVIKSTHAAALYLSDLHARFGNWALALAAYNAGYGLLLKTMRRHNTNNFWALRNIESGLPATTANYTPKVLALAMIGTNAKALGLTSQQIKSWHLVEIPAPSKTRLTDLAKRAGVNAEQLKELNAHLIRGITPPPNERTTLVIPKSWRNAINRAIDKPRAKASFKLHRLRSGESIDQLAAFLHMESEELLELNGGLPSSFYRSGHQIIVPTWVNLSQYPSFPEHAIAVHNLTTRPGHRSLLVRVHANTGARELERTFHTNWAQIVEDNDLDPSARFFDGQTLVVQVPSSQMPGRRYALYLPVDDVAAPIYLRGSDQFIRSELASRGLIRRGHRVREGETLESVGQRYGCSAGSIGRINSLYPKTPLRAGQELVVYTTASRSAGTISPPPLPPLKRSTRTRRR